MSGDEARGAADGRVECKSTTMNSPRRLEGRSEWRVVAAAVYRRRVSTRALVVNTMPTRRWNAQVAIASRLDDHIRQARIDVSITIDDAGADERRGKRAKSAR